MAQMLFDRDSTDKHLNATRRHMRFCKKIKGAETLHSAIEPHYNVLLTRQEARLAKVTLREDARDDLDFADNILDDVVRNIFDACKKYDREHPTARVLMTIFPEGKFGDLINLPVEEEPETLDNLVLRLQSLGEEHSLYKEADILMASIENSKALVTAVKNAAKEEKIAAVEEAMAQAALRNQYEKNYLQARSMFKRAVAERIFPKIKKQSAKTTKVDQDNQG